MQDRLPFNSMRLVFFGTPAFAVPALEALASTGFNILFVVTQPDRPKGRKRSLTPSPVKLKAQELGIPVLQPLNPNHESLERELREGLPDIIVTVAYGQVFEERILSLPPQGCINLHASLLPKYRGAAPITWAILRGEKVTGVTIMLMDKGMDTGPILRKREIAILPDDTTETLSLRLAKAGAEILPGSILDYTSGKLRPVPQDDTEATYAPPLKKQDGKINWNVPASDIERFVRAMVPWPGAYTRMDSRTIKIFRVGIVSDPLPLSPGHGIVTDDRWIVSTGKGAVSLLEIQMEGKKRMDLKQFLKGFKVRGEVSFKT